MILRPFISAETGLAFLLSEANLSRAVDGVLHKERNPMAKMEFNTGIETLTIFLISIVAAVHGKALFSLLWKPGGPSRGMRPADLREWRKKESLAAQIELSSYRRSDERSRAGSITRTTPLVRSKRPSLDPSARNRMLGSLAADVPQTFHRKHSVFVRFVSVRLLRISGPYHVLTTVAKD